MTDTYFDTCARLILEPYKLLAAIEEWLDIAERIAEYDDTVTVMDWYAREAMAELASLDDLGVALALAIDLESKGMDSSVLLKFRRLIWPLAASLESLVNSETIDDELSVGVHIELPLESGTQQERFDLYLEAFSTLRRFSDVVLYRVDIAQDWPTHPPRVSSGELGGAAARYAAERAKRKGSGSEPGVKVGRNGPRDIWLYDERRKGAFYKELRERLQSEHSEWEQLDDDDGVSQALKRHCLRNGYAWPIEFSGKQDGGVTEQPDASQLDTLDRQLTSGE